VALAMGRWSRVGRAYVLLYLLPSLDLEVLTNVESIIKVNAWVLIFDITL
jgi:hypothetical protein